MDWVAVYAAVVATGGLAWQIAQWWRARKVDVRLMFDHVFTASPASDGMDLAMTVHAVNFGERPVTVAAVGLIGFDDDDNLWDDHSRPERIVPHGARASHTVFASSVPFDVTKETRGFVELASGDRIESPVEFADG